MLREAPRKSGIYRVIEHSTIIVVLFAFAVGCGGGAEKASTETIHVAVEIEFGEGEEDVRAELSLDGSVTVADAINQINAVNFEIKGSGSMMFVESIDDVATSAGEGWTYTINGEWANEGIGTKRLSDGDVVRWTFGTFTELSN